jgi:hypothetical protein
LKWVSLQGLTQDILKYIKASLVASSRNAPSPADELATSKPNTAVIMENSTELPILLPQILVEAAQEGLNKTVAPRREANFTKHFLKRLNDLKPKLKEYNFEVVTVKTWPGCICTHCDVVGNPTIC